MFMKFLYDESNIDACCASSIMTIEICEPILGVNNLYSFDYINFTNDDSCFTKIKSHNHVFIVGLELNDHLYSTIKHLIDNECPITYIDNHHSAKYYNEKYDKSVLSSINMFCKEDLSCSMLAWIYGCMYESERKKCDDVDFDFTSDLSLLAINPLSKKNVREYFIPFVIRFIDDFITEKNLLSETEMFSLGLIASINKTNDLQPYSPLWRSIIYNDKMAVHKIVDNGRIVFKYNKNNNDIKNKKHYERIKKKWKSQLITL